MTEPIAYMIIPAVPGFEVLEYFHNGGGPETCVTHHPVVAWRIDPAEDSEYAEPITPEGACKRAYSVIKYPDGRVNWPACQTWPNEASWLADMAIQGEKERKRA